MTTLKKKQHYVWQHYLRPWTAKGCLWCHFQDTNKIIRTSTKGIANETFFYRTHRLTPIDLEYINLLIDRASNSHLQDLHRGTLDLFQSPFLLREKLLRLPLADANRQKLEDHLLEAEKTMGEAFHTFLEGRTARILLQLRKGRADFYQNDDDAMEFVNFLSHQYFRTPKLLRLMRKFPNPYPDLSFERTWLVESQIYATNIGWGILSEKEMYSFEFLMNETDDPFVTGDQPVFNLNGSSNEALRLYYPLSPNLALIYKKNKDPRVATVQRAIHKMEVDVYNQYIFEASSNQAYANNRDSLDRLHSLGKGILK